MAKALRVEEVQPMLGKLYMLAELMRKTPCCRYGDNGLPCREAGNVMVEGRQFCLTHAIDELTLIKG